MKHCPNCQIFVDEQQQVCPLCDSRLATNTNTNSATKANVRPIMALPTYLQPKIVKICRIIIASLVAFALLSVVLNFALFSQSMWACYVVIAVTIVVVCGILPLVNNYPAYKQTKLFLLVVTFVGIVTELTANNLAMPDYTLFSILPSVYFAITLFVDIQILCNKNASVQWIGTLLHSTGYCILPQLVAIIIQNVFDLTEIYNTMSVILVCIFAICNIITLFFAKFEYFKEFFQRNFFV